MRNILNQVDGRNDQAGEVNKRKMKRLLLVLSLVILNGCYTQLAMFHTPKPEKEVKELGYDSYKSYS